uniref:Uncharacterized protein n=1 Tax=Globodera rostochiensis TaxID=31243 RepID=A0A914HXB2_GLORO
MPSSSLCRFVFPISPDSRPSPQAPNAIASPAPFVIAIGGRGSLHVKNGGQRQNRQKQKLRKKQQQKQLQCDQATFHVGLNSAKQRLIRRCFPSVETVVTFLAVVLALGTVASLAIAGWTFHQMNEQHKLCFETMNGQEERLGELESAVTRQQQLETDLKRLEQSIGKLGRMVGARSDEAKFLVNKTMPSIAESNNKNNGDRRIREKHVQYATGTTPQATGSERDFVIYMNGRPMSGRQFVAHGPNGKLRLLT